MVEMKFLEGSQIAHDRRETGELVVREIKSDQRHRETRLDGSKVSRELCEEVLFENEVSDLKT